MHQGHGQDTEAHLVSKGDRARKVHVSAQDHSKGGCGPCHPLVYGSLVGCERRHSWASGGRARSLSLQFQTELGKPAEATAGPCWDLASACPHKTRPSENVTPPPTSRCRRERPLQTALDAETRPDGTPLSRAQT